MPCRFRSVHCARRAKLSLVLCAVSLASQSAERQAQYDKMKKDKEAKSRAGDSKAEVKQERKTEEKTPSTC